MPMKTFNILFFGDVVGKPGRHALIKKLPEFRKKYKADFVIANGENIAHGFGMTVKTTKELMDAGVDFFTSGNHIFKNPVDLDVILKDYPVIRPANYPVGTEGRGQKLIEVNGVKILIINIIGEAFFRDDYANPFKTLDKIIKRQTKYKPQITILDFHAEATSEKKCIGEYADGRVSLVVGTHTHVQTADEQVLPKGTAYITDAGMVGLKHSSLGMDFKNILRNFLEDTAEPKLIPDHGHCIINGIFAKIYVDTGLAQSIERIAEEVTV